MATIEKLTLKIGKRTIELSTEEAKELKDALTELFGGEKTVYVDRIVEKWRDRYPWWPNISYGSGNITLEAKSGISYPMGFADEIAKANEQRKG